MRKLIYSMGVSLDGFIAGPGGEIDWSPPDDELHSFHNERLRAIGVQLCGRRLYETMSYWDTADQDPSLSEVGREFFGLCQATPKLVFSRTLETVGGNARLAESEVGDEVAALKAQPGQDLAAAAPDSPRTASGSASWTSTGCSCTRSSSAAARRSSRPLRRGSSWSSSRPGTSPRASCICATGSRERLVRPRSRIVDVWRLSEGHGHQLGDAPAVTARCQMTRTGLRS